MSLQEPTEPCRTCTKPQPHQPASEPAAAHVGHGAVIMTVDHARRHLRDVLWRSEYAAAERYFGVYAVVSADQAVVTAAHRTRRRRLH